MTCEAPAPSVRPRSRDAAGEPRSDGSFDWYGIAGTWFWIDPVADLVFVGMIQHRGRANSEVQGSSRNLVYQALVN